MWTPHFACPECSRGLDGGVAMRCSCGGHYHFGDGIWRFLTDERRARTQAFALQYRRVRRTDGHHDVIHRNGRTLPHVPAGHPAAAEWRIRRESLSHLLTDVLPPMSWRVLDLGAGSGWLSARMASLGHDVVALDRFDDEVDAGAIRLHDGPPFAVVQADFEALPFALSQFDLVVFSASLHYAASPARVLGSAARMLAPGGVLAVMDSPMFTAADDGEAMVTSQLATLSASSDLATMVRPGIGYLTFDDLDRIADGLKLRTRFIPSRGPLAWRLRRHLAPLRLGRAPAAFGVWVAR